MITVLHFLGLIVPAFYFLGLFLWVRSKPIEEQNEYLPAHISYTVLVFVFVFAFTMGSIVSMN